MKNSRFNDSQLKGFSPVRGLGFRVLFSLEARSPRAVSAMPQMRSISSILIVHTSRLRWSMRLQYHNEGIQLTLPPPASLKGALAKRVAGGNLGFWASLVE